MGLPKPAIQAVSAAATAPALASITTKLKGATVPKAALALAPESRAVRVGRLWGLVSLALDDAAERGRRVLELMNRLRQELPAVLAKGPLKLPHLGFQRLEELVQYLGDALLGQQTGAATRGEFMRKLEGWRWDFVGRVLFERLVKHHPDLDRFFRSAATDLFRMVNEAILPAGATSAQRRAATTLVDAWENVRKVKSPFATRDLKKVMEFRLVGADGVERAFTDFGFLARNGEGLWAALLIELKMPAALRKVAKQFSEFLPRLKEARKIIAVVEEGGVRREIEIAPEDFLLMEHDRGQMAVTGLTEKRLREQLGGAGSPGSPRAVPPGQVGSVVSLDQGTSAKNGAVYYRVRLLVTRSWLEALVRALTDPP